MKDYVNLLFSLIEKINSWEKKNKLEKIEIIKLYVNESSNYEYYVDYFDKYCNFLAKNSLNSLTKDIITL